MRNYCGCIFCPYASELMQQYTVSSMSMVAFDIICFVWIFHDKGSMWSHQSSQDWNDLEVAYASWIKPDGEGTFQKCSISILNVTALITTYEIPGFELKLTIWWSKRFDWRSWSHTSCSLIYFWFPFALITWESAIHFSDSQNSSENLKLC